MSFSDDRDTIELISRASDLHNTSDTDTDTICVFIDNGRVVNSRGRPKLDESIMNPNQFSTVATKEQLVMIWEVMRTLSRVTEDLEMLRDSCNIVMNKMSSIEHRVTNGKGDNRLSRITEYSRVITPLAAFPNGDLANKVDFGEVKYYNGLNGNGSLSSSGIAPVEENKYAPDLSHSNRRSLLDKSSSTFNDEHSSLMTRSLVSNAVSDKPDPIHIIKSKLMNKRVILNVGGERHEVLWKTLEHMPQSRLGLLAAATTDDAIMHYVDWYSLVDNEFFFDRHPRSFLSILNFFRSGRLHIADEMCVVAFNDDLDYWGVNPLWLENCCQNKFLTRKEFIEDEMKKDAELLKKDADEYWGEGMCARSQQFIWDLFEKPESSLAAKVISWVSVLFVIISTVAMILNTMPVFQGEPDENGKRAENEILSMLETICIMWFTLEYILRFAGAPQKCAFLKDFMNIIDLLAILPFFVTVIVLEATPEGEDQEDIQNIRQTISVFRILRVLRIFKLARHSTGLKSIAYTMTNSYKELGLLVLFMSMGVLVFASLIYFAEKDEDDTPFTSIPISFWWAVITMTTVGYGDMYPSTGVGMLIALATCLSGVLVMSLPVPIIVNNFSAFYANTKRKEVIMQQRANKRALEKEEEEQKLLIEREEKLRFLENSFEQ